MRSDLSQPTVSHHLKKLTGAGIVYADRKQGPWTYYRVSPAALAGLAERHLDRRRHRVTLRPRRKSWPKKWRARWPWCQ